MRPRPAVENEAVIRSQIRRCWFCNWFHYSRGGNKRSRGKERFKNHQTCLEGDRQAVKKDGRRMSRPVFALALAQPLFLSNSCVVVKLLARPQYLIAAFRSVLLSRSRHLGHPSPGDGFFFLDRVESPVFRVWTTAWHCGFVCVQTTGNLETR